MIGKTLLMTGATGIMGSWVLGEALDRGVRPIALMRDADPRQARERLIAVLDVVGKADRIDDVRIVQGDATHPGLGLDPILRDELRDTVDLFIHCAASTSFSPQDDETVWRTNVDGTRHVLRFVEDADIDLYHVSTAYVAGTDGRLAYENDLERGQGFNNTYERSKCASERLVRNAFATGKARGAVFRPAIIVGAADGGAISDFLNFYGILRVADLIGRRKPNGVRQLRVEGNPHAPVNLVPVDWTARALWRILEAEGASGETYHLTNPNPHTIEELMAWVNTQTTNSRIAFSVVSELDGATHPLEGMASKAFEHYRVYFQQQPQFDRTNTDRALAGTAPFPEMGPELYGTLVDYARDQEWRGALATAKRSSESTLRAVS